MSNKESESTSGGWGSWGLDIISAAANAVADTATTVGQAVSSTIDELANENDVNVPSIFPASENQHSSQTSLKPEPKPNPQPDTEPDPKSDPEPDTKPDAKPDTKPDTKHDTKPDAEPDTKPDAKPDTKSGPKSGPKPDPKQDSKSNESEQLESDVHPSTEKLEMKHKPIDDIDEDEWNDRFDDWGEDVEASYEKVDSPSKSEVAAQETAVESEATEGSVTTAVDSELIAAKSEVTAQKDVKVDQKSSEPQPERSSSPNIDDPPSTNQDVVSKDKSPGAALGPIVDDQGFDLGGFGMGLLSGVGHIVNASAGFVSSQYETSKEVLAPVAQDLAELASSGVAVSRQGLSHVAEASEDLVSHTYETGKMIATEGIDALEGMIEAIVAPEDHQMSSQDSSKQTTAEDQKTVEKLQKDKGTSEREQNVSPSSSSASANDEQKSGSGQKKISFKEAFDSSGSEGRERLEGLQTLSNQCFSHQTQLTKMETPQRIELENVFKTLKETLTVDEESYEDEELTKKHTSIKAQLKADYKARQSLTAHIQVACTTFKTLLDPISLALENASASDDDVEKVRVAVGSILKLKYIVISSLGDLSADSVKHLADLADRFVDLVSGKVVLGESEEERLAVDWRGLAVSEAEQLRGFYQFFSDEVSDLCEQFLEATDRIFNSVFDENGKCLAEIEECVKAVRTELYLETSNANSMIQDVVELFVPILQSLAMGPSSQR